MNRVIERFKWPETKNPIINIVKLLGRSSIFIFMGLIYLFDRLDVKSKLPLLIIFYIFLLNMAWLFFQQRLKVYKLCGYVIIFSMIWFILMDLFPDKFAITPWW
ncbi:MAG: hypothetical protein Q7T59_05530 [Candidatus Woesebacteria bacterium]|nr:hypothetical protein [Candidatus Woesebacteria bacterium]